VIERILLAALLAAPWSAAYSDCRAVDPARAQVSFELEQAGAPFRGSFKRFGGAVCLADSRVTRIDVWLDPASVDAGLPEIDAALKGDDFFAVARFPRATYSSESISSRAGEQVARGTLTMKGHGAPLDAPFRLQHEGRDVVLSGTLTLNRLDFGIGTGDWSNTKWLGAEVRVSFRATLAQAARGASAQSSVASARSSAAPSPRQALPCMQASVVGRCAASRSSVAAVWGAWAK
jgi:polyisoprenoid-binding protein YceI